MTIDLTQILIAIITLIIAPCVVMLVKEGLELIKAKVKDTRLLSVINDVETAIPTAVDSITQTVVDGLKSQSADGKLSSQDALIVLEMAAEKAERMLTASSLAFLSEQNVNISEYLKDKIEAYIATQKAV